MTTRKRPNFKEDTLSLLINFSSDKGAMIADVEKAFWQIGIHEEDRDVLRFLWWKHENEAE